ncbi:hypothetical protein K505DRAFT_392785 [Melanomma pulvis-pyrius CBS 109.77]|uniref:Uncharacterized protein n=1 Tax=Melanomma pulvis-pyrius CBS 109.77 TaxID=1314802 RepID=A0A6A6WZ21_9PLEO|nr:hypothetical protein K505DRAFT_392785 [Melanomma pulvis-pyrius CBS 109.77]
MEYRFQPVNVPSQQRSNRFEDEIWETHKEAILVQFRAGDAKGISRTLTWIKSQNISGFNPKSVCPPYLVSGWVIPEIRQLIAYIYSSRQLRHRIFEVWKAERSPSENAPQTLGNDSSELAESNTEDGDKDIPLQQDATSRDTFRDANTCPEVAYFEESMMNEKSAACEIKTEGSMLSTLHPNAGKRPKRQNSDTYRPLKRRNARRYTNTERDTVNTSLLPLMDPAKNLQDVVLANDKGSDEQASFEHVLHRSETEETDGLADSDPLIWSGLDDGCIFSSRDTPGHVPSQDDAERGNKTPQSSPGDRQRGAGVLHSDHHTQNLLPVDTLKHKEIRRDPTPVKKAAPTPQENFENTPTMARIPHSSIDKLPDLPSEPSTVTRYQDILPDPVMKPKRLHSLLVQAGIRWDLSIITPWLSRACVIQSHGSPIRRYTRAEIDKIQTFAEIQFAASNLEDAFPLFHQAWTAQGGHSQHSLAIQCARSAVSKSDRVLMLAILERMELPVPTMKWIDAGMIKLMKLEFQPISNAQWTDVLRTFPKPLSEIRQDATSVDGLQIRKYLKIVDPILDPHSYRQSHEVWRLKIIQAWPNCPRVGQLAMFFYLLDSWFSGADLDVNASVPAEVLSTSDRLSEIEILHVISYLVDTSNSGDTFSTASPGFLDVDIVPPTWIYCSNHKLLHLLSQEDGKLLLGFRRCSSLLNASITNISSVSSSMMTYYRDMVLGIFKKRLDRSSKPPGGTKEHPSRVSSSLKSLRAGAMMSAMSVNPTLAKSLSICSTLESMRRLSPMTLSSRPHRWSRFSGSAASIDGLSDQVSLMSISERESNVSVPGNASLELQEEASGRSAGGRRLRLGDDARRRAASLGSDERSPQRLPFV